MTVGRHHTDGVAERRTQTSREGLARLLPLMLLYIHSACPADANTVHSSLVARHAPPRCNCAERFGKYAFGEPEYLGKQYLPLTRVFAFPDGRAAYEARGGAITHHGRVLFVGKP